MPRAAFLLAALLLPAAPLPAPQRAKPIDVTADQLWKAPEKYQGKLVRLEGVVESTSERPRSDKTTARYTLYLKGAESIYIFCEGKRSAAKGDRVRVTGTFTYKRNSFLRRSLAVPAGEVQKLPAKK